MDKQHFCYICGMKNINLILILLLLPVDLYGKIPSKSHWTPVHPAFDLLVDSLEKGWISDVNDELRSGQVDRLYRLAGKHPGEPVFRWRADFWNARLQFKKNNSDSAFRLIEKTIAGIDSVRYLYDYMRLLHLYSFIHHDRPHLTYKNLRKVSDFYKKAGDRLMLSNAYVDLGNILTRLNDLPKALDYFLKADSLYRELNIPVYRAKNQLNISNVLYLTQKEQQAGRILKQLLADPVCKKDTAFYINTLLCLAEHDFCSSKKQLFEAYELSKIFGHPSLSTRTEAFLGSYYQETGQTDSALFYYRKTCRGIHDRHIDLLVPVYKQMSDCFYDLRIPDSAYLYLTKYVQISDSLEQVNSLAEIRRIESRASIEKYELEIRQRKERAGFQFAITVMICSFVVCLACLICYIFWKKHREAQIKRKLKNLENNELSMRLEHEALQNNYYKIELESKERQLASHSLQVIEKSQMLETLLELIEKEKEARHIETGTAAKIIGNIKSHMGTGDEWDFFKIQFEKVHPDFFTRLKNLCPSVTEGELRICSYIRIGMENKHIAQMLSLQPDSIKKTRYRIRKKLNIEPETSLEDYLRKTEGS